MTSEWGINRSSASRKSTPAQKPPTAGRKDQRPREADCSIAMASGSEVAAQVSTRIHIPTFAKGAGPESLNVATAAAIVLSEFRRR